MVLMQKFPRLWENRFIKEYVKYNNIKNYIHLSNEYKSKLMKNLRKV